MARSPSTTSRSAARPAPQPAGLVADPARVGGVRRGGGERVGDGRSASSRSTTARQAPPCRLGGAAPASVPVTIRTPRRCIARSCGARAADSWPGSIPRRSTAARRLGGSWSSGSSYAGSVDSVGSTRTPPATIASSRSSSGRAMPASVRHDPCSRPSTPAATACRTPTRECACASTGRPAPWAASTTARQLLGGELHAEHVGAGRHHPAAGHHLDHVDAALGVGGHRRLARRPRRRPRRRGSGSARRARSAADRRPGSAARPASAGRGGRGCGTRVSPRSRTVVTPARACRASAAAIARSRASSPAPPGALEPTGGAVAHEVHVRVDETRKHRPVVRRDRDVAGERVVAGLDADDAPAVDEHGGAAREEALPVEGVGGSPRVHAPQRARRSSRSASPAGRPAPVESAAPTTRA